MNKSQNNFISIIFLAIFSMQLQAATIALYGNYHTMGVIIGLNDGEDPENDAVANIEYRSQGGTYQEGFPATRTNDTQFAGSIFWLQPGNTYDVRVTITDSTTPGLDNTILEQTGSTRPDPVWHTATTSYYVSPTGSGTAFTEANPGALSDAVSLVQAGEEIVLLDGIYYEGEFNLTRSGNAGEPITIRAQTGASAIMDGSDPSVFAWNDEGNDIYSTTLNVANTQLVVADGRRLYNYNSYSDLDNLIWGLDGFYEDNGTLYVKITGVNPADVEMIISKQHYAFDMTEQDYFHFRDITFRYYGQGNWSKALYFFSSSYNVVDNCTFAVNNNGIGIKYDSDQITIQNCEFYDDSDMWDWDAMKAAGDIESTCISFYDPVYGRGHIIRNNVIHDCMDGMSPGSFYHNPSTQEMDIYDNLIYNSGDDGISADGYVSNVRIWNNTIHDVLTGISFAPIEKGPAYAIRNLVYNTGYGNSDYSGLSFKFNSGYDPSGTMYLFHNTSDAVLPNVDGIEFKIPGDWELVYSRNNAFTGNDFAFSFIETGGNRELDMDFDNLYTTDSDKFAYWYDSQSNYYPTLAAFQTATNLELNGICETPLFTSPATGDYTLQSTSNLINAGVYIPGINDDFVGSAPDIGAFEYQSSLSVAYFSPLVAFPEDNRILLKWTTINEQNSDHFLLQRFHSGTGWEVIERIKGSSTFSSSHQYKTYDYNPKNGISYYRLKQVDIDGSFSYSNIASVKFENLDFSFSPNPTDGIINIVLSKNIKSQIFVYNIFGNIVFKEYTRKNPITLDLHFLPEGIYFIGLEKDNDIMIKKMFMKM